MGPVDAHRRRASSRWIAPAAIPGGKRFYTLGYVGSAATGSDDPDLYRVDLADAAHTFTKLNSINAGPEGDVTCAFGNDKKPYADLTYLGYDSAVK